MTTRPKFGHFVQSSTSGEQVNAYIPGNLPPKPPLDMEALYPLLEKANIALGRLDGTSINVPNPDLFLYMYVRKEAVLSSQIEGTQSTLSDLLLFENEECTGVPIDDVIEVSNYVAAMEYGLKKIRTGFPLCMRLLREMHAILLNNNRGSTKQPGEFRQSQNWIGGTRPGNATYVPPPWEKVEELLSNLEKFLHDEKGTTSTLIKAGLAHLQFESIHPFLDGNGRLGRLLITFILCIEGTLKEPLLYLSLYFKTNKKSYYDHLQYVRDTGDWEEWLHFFLTGVIETSDQAIQTIHDVLALFESDHEKILNADKTVGSTLLIYEYLKKHPITDAKSIVQQCDISLPTANNVLRHLVDLTIIKEITGQARNRIYSYQHYIDVMSSGITP